VNKKQIIITSSIVIFSIILSGCTSQNDTEPLIEDNVLQNHPPEPVVTIHGGIQNPPSYIDTSNMDAVAYAGDIITFDASNSYDADDDVLSYKWIWDDYTDSTGEKVTRKFQINDVFSLQGLPLIYSITLVASDEKHSGLTAYHLGIVPKKHTFYLDDSKITLDKPSSGKYQITATAGKLREFQTLTYELDQPLLIQQCTWNATVYLEKSKLAVLNKISISLKDEEGNIIVTKDTKLQMFPLWKSKTVVLSGVLTKREEFKSVEIQVQGFSFKNRINVLSGGEKSSQIEFDFTTL